MSDRRIAQAARLNYCGAVPPEEIRETSGQTCVLQGNRPHRHRSLSGMQWSDPHAPSCLVCGGAVGAPEHDPVEGHIVSGLAANGHTRFWATVPSRGFVGPFRSTRGRAQRDLDEFAAPSRWHVVNIGGQVHVGRHTLTGIECISGPSGPIRYGRIENARAEARARNELLRNRA